MADDAAPNARDAKLIDWLDEAYANESRLEADLSTQISLIEKPAYKKRLQGHLKETKEHERLIAKRIGQLGGRPEGPAIPTVVSAVGEAAGKAVAAVRGQIAARASAAGGVEAQVRIAEDQVREEHVEIAIYTRIEAFAEAVGDSETAKLARAILRDEERMAKFLAAELPKLVRDFARAEIPKDQRVTRTRRRARSASASASPQSQSRSSSSPQSARGATRSRSGSRTSS
jgi:ferritin-like metal-binding protein YciE